MRSSFFNKQSMLAMGRISGLAYLIYSLNGLYITFGPTHEILANVSATNFDNHSAGAELFFRSGLLAETIMYLFTMISAAAMYSYLRHVGPGMAAIGGFCRLAESIMGASFIIFGYAILLIVSRPEMFAGMPEETRYVLLGFFRNLKSSAIFFLLVIMSAGAILYYVLFFKSQFIPRWLSCWGIFTYATVGIAAILVIMFPTEVQKWVMIVFLLGAAFEFTAGFWLAIVGIKTDKWEVQQSLSNSTAMD